MSYNISRRDFAKLSAASILALALPRGANAGEDTGDFNVLLEKAVAESKAPSAVAYVGRGDDILFRAAVGKRQLIPAPLPATVDTIYDLASLTKVTVTTTLALIYFEEYKLDLEAPVSTWLDFPLFKTMTPRHLLTHTSGLPAGHPFSDSAHSVDGMLAEIAAIKPVNAPGDRRAYSDLGFIMLGAIMERIGGKTLDVLAQERIFAPLGMTRTMYCPPESLRSACAPTEDSKPRGRLIIGEVHDENASSVGGVSGHAGLFSTVDDLAIYCRALMGGKIVKPVTLDMALDPANAPSCWPWQGLGWRIDPWRDGDEGYLPARSAFGHSGWTGTSMWMDKATGVFAILLANTCHPSRDKRDSVTLRDVFHTGLSRRLYPGQTNVHTGLDRLKRGRFADIDGKRLAVLTHGAAMNQFGRPVLEALKESSADVRVIYSPEHGLQGQAEAGEHVKGQTGGQAAIVSLYGERKAPTPEELAGIDLLVVDLQDVGARYYTYPATMLECMVACAKAKKPVMVLDRPNPLGGVILEGPVAKVFGSNVCRAPIPIRHGMTLGELARFLKKQFVKDPLELEVITADNWREDIPFHGCSLAWTPPSPNIPTPDAALLYIGLCLLEGTNLNEGRGTETPFQLAGAPWLDAAKAIAAMEPRHMEGLKTEAVRYTPAAIPGKASSPRHKDVSCGGIKVDVVSWETARPFAFAVEILRAINATHPGKLEFASNFHTLAGGQELKEHILAGKDTASFIASCEAGYESYRKEMALLRKENGYSGPEAKA